MEPSSSRLGALWEEWSALGAHLVEDGWLAPSGLPVFTDSGTYAPTFLVGSWRDDEGATHVFELGPEDAAYLPQGCRHEYRNVAGTTARALLGVAPSYLP